MKSSNLLIFGGLAVGALFLFKDHITSLLSPGNGGFSISAPNPNSQQIQVSDITNASQQQIKEIPKPSGSVKDASGSVLNAIDVQAKANPSKVTYYPDYGIVTKGGQGFSTAYPEKYVDTKASSLAKMTSLGFKAK